jgi:hypothetical protein
MLGRPWFLLLVAMISLIACLTFYIGVTAPTDQIVVNTYAIASIAFAMALISLVLIFVGFASRSMERPLTQ